MSESLSKTKHRIATIKSTLKITGAMKLISNVKMNHFKKVLNEEEGYFNSLKTVFNDVVFLNSFNPSSPSDNLYLKGNSLSNKTIYIVLTSDLGLCGSYNIDTFKLLNSLIKKDDYIIVIGNKGYNYYSKNNDYQFNFDFTKLQEGIDNDKIQGLADFVSETFKTNEYSKVMLVYHHYVNSLVLNLYNEQLLPLTVKENPQNRYDPIFVTSKKELTDELAPMMFKGKLALRLYESLICEYNSRRNAMNSADDNAKDMLEKLSLSYNKYRQQAITQEITEVVTAANNR